MKLKKILGHFVKIKNRIASHSSGICLPLNLSYNWFLWKNRFHVKTVQHTTWFSRSNFLASSMLALSRVSFSPSWSGKSCLSYCPLKCRKFFMTVKERQKNKIRPPPQPPQSHGSPTPASIGWKIMPCEFSLRVSLWSWRLWKACPSLTWHQESIKRLNTLVLLTHVPPFKNDWQLA